jgi:hypothetical protein
VRPHNLDQRLTDYEHTPKDAAQRKQWADVIRGIQGVTLRVQLSDKARGSLQVDFEGDAAAFGDQAKPVVLYALDELGVGIEELEKWKAIPLSNAIVLEGELTSSAMRKVFSLLELPSTKFSTLKDAEPAGDSVEGIGKASQAYFQSVSTLLDDLRKEFETNRDARRSWASVYLERYGRKIDRLPILNVDEELLAYGANVGETLRSMSVAQKSGAVTAGARKSQVYGAYQYNYDSNGYYGTRSTQSVRTQIDREEQSKARVVRFESWKELEDATSAIRKKMTATYQLEF